MNFGLMDRRIDLQAAVDNSPAQDGDGQPDQSWNTVATLWASRTDNRGQEIFAAQGKTALADTLFRIRYRADITERNRVVDDRGRVYDIKSVVELGRREAMELYCTAVVG